MVWHSSLTAENIEDLERVQKVAFKVILGKKYEDYEDALDKLNLQTLIDRREYLCLQFARNTLKNPKVTNMFPLKQQHHHMNLRNSEKYEVQYAKKQRLIQSAIPSMQRMLNAKSRSMKD